MSLDAESHILLYLLSHPDAYLKKGAAEELNHPLLKLIGPDYNVLDQLATITIEKQGENTVVNVKTTGPAPWDSAPNLRLNFLSDPWDWKTSPAPAKDLPGVLFLRGSAPKLEYNNFYIQEFPPLKGSEPRGRINIEFWNDNLITAVFKTNTDNDKTAIGKGKWSTST